MSEQIEKREIRYWILVRRRKQYQFLRAVLVGLLAGAVAVLFERALWSAEQLRGHLLMSLQHSALRWVIMPLIAATAGAVASYITYTHAPEASGSGIPHVKAVLMNLRQMRKRVLPVKFIGGILAIGAGFSLGREGPTVQMGAVAGKMISQWLRVSPRYRMQLVAAGAGAGLAAAFNAPLAGFIFVIEELQREMSPLTYGTALIAAVVSDIVTRWFTGQMPSFHVPSFATPGLPLLPLFVLLGLLCGALGTAFNWGLLSSLNWMNNLNVKPRWLKAAAVGVAVGLVMLFMPAAVGGGHSVAEAIMRGDTRSILTGFPFKLGIVQFLLILFILKFILTELSYSSGVPGGIFAPLLVLGAVAGAAMGYVCAAIFPFLGLSPATFAALGMAAMFASIVRAPLTGVVLILEMTGNYGLLFALLVTAMISYITADHMGTKPIYESLLDNDLEKAGEVEEVHTTEPTMVNLVVEPHSRMDQKRLREIPIPKRCLLVTINRAGRDMVPHGDTVLQSGDQLSVLCAGKMGSILAVRELAKSESKPD